MNRGAKTVIYVLLAALALFFGWRFQNNYSRLMSDQAEPADSDLINVNLPEERRKAAPLKTEYHLGGWGAGVVISVILLGLLAAHDLSQHFGNRALKVLYNDDAEPPTGPDYEKAEEEWAQGNYLEAIRLMREYLQEHPREQHVALRIAEIYEKDLQNPLAAALEYEEVLKQKLPPERWGWAAIHLCNLYTSKLNQPEKGIALLRRIDAEHGQTAAAEKARKRLEHLQAEGIIPPPDDASSASGLPPGFAPKKGS